MKLCSGGVYPRQRGATQHCVSKNRRNFGQNHYHEPDADRSNRCFFLRKSIDTIVGPCRASSRSRPSENHRGQAAQRGFYPFGRSSLRRDGISGPSLGGNPSDGCVGPRRGLFPECHGNHVALLAESGVDSDRPVHAPSRSGRQQCTLPTGHHLLPSIPAGGRIPNRFLWQVAHGRPQR